MSTAGAQRVLGHYELPGGDERVLVGQRINGRVAISDLPAGDDGPVYLVERHIESHAAMDGLVATYIAESRDRGEPAILVPRELRADDGR